MLGRPKAWVWKQLRGAAWMPHFTGEKLGLPQAGTGCVSGHGWAQAYPKTLQGLGHHM